MTLQQYSLKDNGDKLEQYAYNILLLPDRFPSYELFWKKFVVPLSYRPKNILLREDKDLVGEIKNKHANLCIAQLHYSVLANLIIAHDILFKKIDYLKSGVATAHINHFFMNIFAASDVAAELIIRYQDLLNLTLDPWNDDKTIVLRKEFIKNNEPDIISKARKYRNRLIHGRLPLSFRFWPDGKDQLVPKIGKEKEYMDWRRIIYEPVNEDDFQPVTGLMKEVFEQITIYLEDMWQKYLLNKH